MRLSLGEWSASESFEIQKDPRIQTSMADYQSQLELALQVRDLLSETYDTLKTVRSLKEQVTGLSDRLTAAGLGEGLEDTTKELIEKLSSVEGKLYQTKNQSFQDTLNFQPMLDNQIAGLYAVVIGSESKPTAGSYDRYQDLKQELSRYRSELDSVTSTELARFNTLVMERSSTPVIPPKFSTEETTNGQQEENDPL